VCDKEREKKKESLRKRKRRQRKTEWATESSIVTCVVCSLNALPRGNPSASACVNPLMAVHGSFTCIIAKGGSAFIIARACVVWCGVVC
jgi:hypothetical protein